jgi:hypothetical protein
LILWRSITDVKESAKDTASEAKEYVKDTGSSMADKGRGKSNACKSILGKLMQRLKSYFASKMRLNRQKTWLQGEWIRPKKPPLK